jgi:hypothetical protein
LPVAAVLGGTLLAARAAGWLRRAVIRYLGLDVLALAVGFVLAASIAGVSMAAVEGVAVGSSARSPRPGAARAGRRPGGPRPWRR